MKYFFTLVLFLAVSSAQAQVHLIMEGINAARLASRVAAQQKAAKAADTTTAATPAAAGTPGHYVTPFTYHGQQVSRQRTAPKKLKGKGAAEIQALEASLEKSNKSLLADSVQSFFPAAKYEAVVEAACQAAAARPG
ncbi:hypothetical protein LGH70_04730 [Hymenobacter sp. BT635]|uniref:DUF4168 domain-containing protein n=1 Tax=Hymenobacter nitidus TaxID=2880929 RepID=A0ABS8A901_9BACT|nr:hypothetical protein [Hymenobacter nitidus]MCB2376873.1 hypothetical protein [Hymenobacter nitidus]